MCRLGRSGGRWILGVSILLVGNLGEMQTLGEEVTVQNDSLSGGDLGNIQAGFVAGESAAVWLISPCDGTIVAVQVFWRSLTGTAPQSLEESIKVLEAGSFPVPGSLLALIEGPVMTDSVINEFRYLDENQTIPLSVPIDDGEEFVISFTFLNSPDPVFGPSLVTDVDGCQAGKSAIDAQGIGWISACLLGLTGDFVIRAVVECGDLPGACCELSGDCADGRTEPECIAAGGAFQGGATDCGSVICLEACCFSPTACLDLTVADCDIADGFHQGPGTDCATTVCFPTGACCNPDGSCDDDVLDTDCEAGGGIFQGAATLCSEVTCPQPDGACCLASGGCLVLSEEDCGVIPNSFWPAPLTDCTDADESGIADACELPPINPPLPASGPDSARTNRYISFDPNNTESVAFQVEMTASTYFPTSTGILGWVGEPFEAPEDPGVWVARVVDTAFYSDAWSAVVHLGDCETIPVATYHLRATSDEVVFSEPLELGTIAQPAPKYWADCVGALEEDGWTGPNGVVNFDDVVAAIQYFTSAPTAPHITWIDVHDQAPNVILNFDDIFWIVQGFKGEPYPFSDPAQCP